MRDDILDRATRNLGERITLEVPASDQGGAMPIRIVACGMRARASGCTGLRLLQHFCFWGRRVRNQLQSGEVGEGRAGMGLAHASGTLPSVDQSVGAAEP